MKIPRRNFLAVLLAPILAKFAPKPLAGERVFTDEELKYACAVGTGWMEPFYGQTVDIVTYFAPDGTIYEIYGDHILQISHHHVRPPVVRWTKAMDPEVWPWEDEA